MDPFLAKLLRQPLDDLLAASRAPEACVGFLEAVRWGPSPTCPRCGSDSVYRIGTREGGRNQRYLWRCRSCNRQHTVRTGNWMAADRSPLHLWCWAVARARQGTFDVASLRERRDVTEAMAIAFERRLRPQLGGSESETRGGSGGESAGAETAVPAPAAPAPASGARRRGLAWVGLVLALVVLWAGRHALFGSGLLRADAGGGPTTVHQPDDFPRPLADPLVSVWSSGKRNHRLRTWREEGETDNAFLDRHLRMLALAQEKSPPTSPPSTSDE